MEMGAAGRIIEGPEPRRTPARSRALPRLVLAQQGTYRVGYAPGVDLFGHRKDRQRLPGLVRYDLVGDGERRAVGKLPGNVVREGGVPERLLPAPPVDRVEALRRLQRPGPRLR